MRSLDLDKLREYYHEGWGATGKPNDRYYIHTKRGTMSLQGYVTERAFAADTYDRGGSFIQEVSVDGTDFNQESINEDEFMNRLRQDSTKVFLTTLGAAKAPTYEYACDFINGVYGGNWDKQVWLDCMMDNPPAYNQLRDSFKSEINDRLEAEYNSVSGAAFEAYMSVLSRDSRTFAGNDVEASDKLMRRAVRDYAERVVSMNDQYTNQDFVSTESINAAQDIFAEGYTKCKENPDINRNFNRLMKYLSKGLVIDMSVSGRNASITPGSTEMSYDPDMINRQSLDEMSADEDDLPVSMMTESEIEDMARYLTQYIKDNPHMDVDDISEDQLMVNFVGGISTFVGTPQVDSEVEPDTKLKQQPYDDDGPDL